MPTPYISSPSARSSSRTRSRAALALLLSVGLAPALAAADDSPESRRSEALTELWWFAAANDAAKDHGVFDGFRAEVARCHAAVKDGSAAGYQPLDTFERPSGPMLWRNAGRICDEYARLQPVAAAVIAIAPMHGAVMLIRGLKSSGLSSEGYRGRVETARRCVAAVDDAVKAGAPAELKFAPNANVNETLVSLAEVRAQCSEFIDWGAKTAAAVDTAADAEEAALRGRYTKYGITGDRLKYLMDADNRIVMGKGCRELDMAQKKKAAVLFEMAEADWYWIVYKMTFKGDKLVKTTERRYGKASSNGWTCK